MLPPMAPAAANRAPVDTTACQQHDANLAQLLLLLPPLPALQLAMAEQLQPN